MRDCENVTVRELLPDLLHDRLTADQVQVVEAHLATCADCRAELGLLRDMRSVLAMRMTPRVDVATIVAALPRAAATPAVRPMRWRWAAAITLVVLGGTSVATAVRSFRGDPVVVDSVAAPQVVPQVATVDSPRTPASTTPENPSAPARLTAGGDVGDLVDEDLEALIGALDRIEGIPVAEPEASRHSRWISGSTGGA